MSPFCVCTFSWSPVQISLNYILPSDANTCFFNFSFILAFSCKWMQLSVLKGKLARNGWKNIGILLDFPPWQTIIPLQSQQDVIYGDSSNSRSIGRRCEEHVNDSQDVTEKRKCGLWVARGTKNQTRRSAKVRKAEKVTFVGAEHIILIQHLIC